MKQVIQKYISIFTITIVLFTQSIPMTYAQEAPVAPTAPETPTVSTMSDAPTAPAAPTAPTQPSGSTTQEEQNTTQNQQSDAEDDSDNNDDDPVSNTDPNASKFDPTLTDAQVAAENAEREARKAAYLAALQAQNTSGQTGDTSVKTGDATNNGTATTLGNTNLGTSGGCCVNGGAQVVNSGNGSGSTNTGSATLGNNNLSNQNNSAVINSDLALGSTTGSNNTSNNVGSSSISTGDANTTGTVITAVNTNAQGIMVSEFNVNDDHTGDILLDFGAGCVLGCITGDAKVANTGNGSDSTNTASVDGINNNATFQTNTAGIGNDLVLSADSGNNVASRNTGGDSDITTGDANVSANALTFANNNIAGNVIYGVVNIFGDLIGDILFPQEQLDAMDAAIAAQNAGNGSDSTNTANLNLANNNNTFQGNDADIANNLVFDATTGDNDASRNTGGDSSIESGDTSIDANVLNIANSNLNGGTWWLVLVNEAGNWVGKILGADENANFAGSAGTDFAVDENGYITASNAGNGSGSENTSSVNQENNNTTVQNNDAAIANNLHLSANTGGNQASDNTGGTSNIKTGDATIVANLVNFVNNNIVGNGKLVVTVVNVFGSWLGDFVAPGQKQQEKTTAQNNNSSNTSDNRGGSSSNTPETKKTVTTKTTSNNTADDGVTTVTTDENTRPQHFAGRMGLSTEGEEEATLAKVQPASAVKGIATKKVIEEAGNTVNLAWIVLLVPLAGAAFLSKRMMYKVSRSR